MISVQFLAVDDVLLRGIELLKTPLPHAWAACEFNLGPYCPRCAVARATTDLCEEHQLRFNAGDEALEAAAMYISRAGDNGTKALSQSEAEVVMTEALEHARRYLEA